MKTEISVFHNLNEASYALASFIAETARKTVESKGRFFMALSGGKTPEVFYGLLASEFADSIPWQSVHLFWGDERYVLKDHPDSNYALAFRTLISKVPLIVQNIHRIPTELKPQRKAAEAYQATLHKFFSTPKKDPLVSFDVILLGMGEDGHTAALFPENPALREKERWVVPTFSSSPFSPQPRISLTLPVINGSRTGIFLVSGSKKTRTLRSILINPKEVRHIYPAAMVCPREKLFWIIDQDALNGISYSDISYEVIKEGNKDQFPA
ncbi:6-phosphogluconolactonase [Acidobacteriota bacterium]